MSDDEYKWKIIFELHENRWCAYCVNESYLKLEISLYYPAQVTISSGILRLQKRWNQQILKPKNVITIIVNIKQLFNDLLRDLT